MPPRTEIFADHFDGLTALVADALEYGHQIFERDLFTDPQDQRKLTVEVGRLGSK